MGLRDRLAEVRRRTAAQIDATGQRASEVAEEARSRAVEVADAARVRAADAVGPAGDGESSPVDTRTAKAAPVTPSPPPPTGVDPPVDEAARRRKAELAAAHRQRIDQAIQRVSATVDRSPQDR